MASDSDNLVAPRFPDSAYDVVAIAASAGGLQALSDLLSELPADFPVPIAIVQHLDRDHRSWMAEILDKRTPLTITQAIQGDRLRPGNVYIAPPNRHLIAQPQGMLLLTQGDRVHFSRPSADLLFKSVAETYGPRAIAVVLTGTGSDGSDGIRAIKAAGGATIAQDEATSEYFGMPGAAIKTGNIDCILPLNEIAPALTRMVMGPDD